MENLGRMLVIAGLVIAAAGVLLIFGDRLPFRLGRLPGDIVYRGRNSVFYFPLATSLVVSLVLSLILAFFGRR